MQRLYFDLLPEQLHVKTVVDIVGFFSSNFRRRPPCHSFNTYIAHPAILLYLIILYWLWWYCCLISCLTNTTWTYESLCRSNAAWRQPLACDSSWEKPVLVMLLFFLFFLPRWRNINICLTVADHWENEWISSGSQISLSFFSSLKGWILKQMCLRGTGHQVEGCGPGRETWC